MTVSDPGADVLAERLGARTLDLVAMPSVSGDEGDVFAWIREHIPPGLQTADDGDAVLFLVPSPRRRGVPFVVLAGHVDTVPPANDAPPTRGGGYVGGRGAADMKGALAVMLELGETAGARTAPDLDMGLLFFGREELPITQSALLPFLERCALGHTIDLAIVMEPTSNTIQVGCLGNLDARVVVRGKAAHAARPWLGDNAIHRAIAALAPLADLPIRDVNIDGLVFREVVSVTMFRGGTAANVVPDYAEARVSFRYAPSLSPSQAEVRLQELLSPYDVELEVVGNAPPGPVNIGNPLVERLRTSGDLPVGPKQAWTSVAEFATVGVEAVNFGPGDPRYAHRDDECIAEAELVRSYEVLSAFLADANEGPG